MKRLVAIAFFLSLLAAAALRADTFEGHLLPKKCRGDNPAQHTRACALDCKTSGFGVVTAAGDYLPFDGNGNRKAVAALEASHRAADLRIRVTGTLDRGLLNVDTLQLLEDPAAAPAAAAEAPAKRAPLATAILLFDGVQTIDYTGPYEVLADAVSHGEPAFRVFTVAEKPGTIRTVAGMTVTPDFTLANAPHADVIVIPGGAVAPILERPAVIDWVRRAADKAQIVLSVCNGSFFLAKANLIDGVEVTSTAENLIKLQELAPRAKVTGAKRVTDNGKIVTSGGLAAGIDGALHVVSRVAGEPLARALALYLEYRWDDDASFVPGTLAFRHVAPLVMYGVFPLGADIASSEGNEREWILRANVASSRTPAELAAMVGETAGALPRWKATRTTSTSACYAFTDYDGAAWSACYEVAPAANGVVPVTVRVQRM